VTDKDTGAPMAGVTVIVQGPQGEDATVTDEKGAYRFSSLTVGTYVIRYYAANTSTQVEQAERHRLGREDRPRERQDRGGRPGRGPADLRHHGQAVHNRHRQLAPRHDVRQRTSR